MNLRFMNLRFMNVYKSRGLPDKILSDGVNKVVFEQLSQSWHHQWHGPGHHDIERTKITFVNLGLRIMNLRLRFAFKAGKN